MTIYADRAKTPQEWIFRAEKITRRYLRWRIYHAIKHYKVATPDSVKAAEMASISAVDKLIQAGYIDIDALDYMGEGEEDAIRH